MSAVLMERNAVIQNTKAIFSAANYEALLHSDTQAKSVMIANEQQCLLVA